MFMWLHVLETIRASCICCHMFSSLQLLILKVKPRFKLHVVVCSVNRRSSNQPQRITRDILRDQGPHLSTVRRKGSIFVLPYIYSHSTYKYKLVNHTICVKLCLRTHYPHICAYALLINEGPGTSHNSL